MILVFPSTLDFAISFSQIKRLVYIYMQTLHVQNLLFQFFMTSLNDFSFSEDLYVETLYMTLF